MKKSALKIISLMTFTLVMACGDDSAAPMITEIKTMVVDGPMIRSSTVMEIDYRNGNEVDLVSVYRNGVHYEERAYYYDPHNRSVDRIDLTLLGSKTQTMLAEYNEHSDISLIYEDGSTRASGTSLQYEDGFLISHKGPNLDVLHTYSNDGRLESSKTANTHLNLRWTDALLTSIRKTSEGATFNTQFEYNKDGQVTHVSSELEETEITYDVRGRIHKVIRSFGNLSHRSITTYKYAEGTIAGVQPTLDFMGGEHFGMDGRPRFLIPMVTFQGFNID